MTRIGLAAAAAAAAMTSAAAAQHGGTGAVAGASLKNAEGRIVGEANATREDGLVRVRLTVRGFAPGTYAVHLHETGRCEAPDFASAGAHWNPEGRQHGRLNPRGPHAGDLPNLEVRANGTGRIDFDAPVPAADAHPLLDADGTAIVIHARPDDHRTDPSGNSGDRIACGVLAPVR